MITVHPEIFHAYDIRGVAGRDFDEDFAFQLGAALAHHWGNGHFVVGRDSRPSSGPLAEAVARGAQSVGAEVRDIGQTMTPLWDFAARHHGGGIMVTASHNPGAYNGFKCVNPQGEVVSGVQLKALWDGAGELPSTETHHPIQNYTEQATAEYYQAIQSVAGIHDTAWLNLGDGLESRFDTDGDRVEILEDGVVIPTDQIAALLATRVPTLQPVVHDLLFSRGVREYLADHNIPAFEMAVGHPAAWQAMREHQAMLGAEGSGHIYFASFGNFECPELVLVYVDRIRRESGSTLRELTAPMRTYVRTTETIPLTSPDQFDAMIKKLREKYLDGEIKTLDGLSVDYPDWWFNIRRSNTEPIIRLTIEAKESGLLMKKAAELRGLLSAI